MQTFIEKDIPKV